MRKLMIVFGCVTMVLFSSLVYSAEGVYGRFSAGLALRSDSDLYDPRIGPGTFEEEYDMGVTLGAALGYDRGGNTRVDFEVAYQENGMDTLKAQVGGIATTGDASALSFMINGYYDFHNRTEFIPYMTAGLGVADIKIDDFNYAGSGIENISESDVAFTYQLGVGVRWAVTESVTLDGGYRYLRAKDVEYGDAKVHFTSHNVTVGVCVSF